RGASPSRCSGPFEVFLQLAASRQRYEKQIRMEDLSEGVQDCPVRFRDQSEFVQLHRVTLWRSSGAPVPVREAIGRKDFGVPVPHVLSETAADPLPSEADDYRNPLRLRRSGRVLKKPRSSATCTE